MLAFDRVDDAIAAAVMLRESAASAGLPPLHTGISAGPVIERDGDYFGRTVNLASRISGVAAAGEIVMSAAAAEATKHGARLTPLGPTALKGLASEVHLYLLP
jgi:class 3 adenylate cyclase